MRETEARGLALPNGFARTSDLSTSPQTMKPTPAQRVVPTPGNYAANAGPTSREKSGQWSVVSGQ
jgi:hypothetical protein